MQEMDVRVRNLSAILCNDKPTSFGAPDVLQANADQLVVRYAADRRQVCPTPSMPGAGVPSYSCWCDHESCIITYVMGGRESSMSRATA